MESWYFITSIAIGSIFSIFGEWFDCLLAKNGIVRRCKFCATIGTFVMVFIKQIWFPDFSWLVFGIVLILGLTIGIHRGDLYTTSQKGRWWWKEEQKPRESENRHS